MSQGFPPFRWRKKKDSSEASATGVIAQNVCVWSGHTSSTDQAFHALHFSTDTTVENQ